ALGAGFGGALGGFFVSPWRWKLGVGMGGLGAGGLGYGALKLSSAYAAENNDTSAAPSDKELENLFNDLSKPGKTPETVPGSTANATPGAALDDIFVSIPPHLLDAALMPLPYGFTTPGSETAVPATEEAAIPPVGALSALPAAAEG